MLRMLFQQEFSLLEEYVVNEPYRKDGNVHQVDYQIEYLSLSHIRLVGESRCYQKSLSRVNAYCTSLTIFYHRAYTSFPDNNP